MGDGFGRWYGAVPVGEATRLGSQSRAMAVNAIYSEIVEREQRTGETEHEFKARIPMPRVEIAPPDHQHAGWCVWREVDAEPVEHAHTGFELGAL